ncbi:MAG: cobalamin-dependent protein [Sedimentisphaerales bacterium]|nr:cobalamin-dependent protein [Sedimentisphaerales bacterium]MBN2844278.1 cobalamin-dependent protein [Sedimentisphaerales bacterium]
MNFLIIVPKYSPVWVYYEFPVGLASISASLKKAGFSVWCLNLNHYPNEDHEKMICRTLDEHNINIVCTGGLVVHFNIINNILSLVKKHDPNIMTIVGGGLITCEPELIFENLSVDCGVLGEGDQTIVELARALVSRTDPAQVNGLIFRNRQNEIVRTPARQAIADISQLPMPDYEGFELDRYLDMQLPSDTTNMHVYDEPRIIPVISSRSCPYQCRFCYHPLGNKYRSRDLDNFFGEVEYLIDRYNVNGLLVLDELLCHKRERLVEFCRRISQYHLRWMGQLRVDSVDTEMLAMLKESGCYLISYGIESAHNDILRSMRKNTTVEQIEKALDLTYQAGISLQGNLLFSDRSETEETAEQSILWAMKRWYHRIQLTPLFALPDSSDYRYAVETGRIADRLKYIKNGCGAVNLTEMSHDKLARIYDKISSFSNHLLLLPKEYEIEQTGFDFARSTPIYSFSFKCPHCGRRCHYENFCLYGTLTNNRYIHCKHCRGRSDIMIDWFDHYKDATYCDDNKNFLESTNEYRKSCEHFSAPYKEIVNMTPPAREPGQYFCWRFKARPGHSSPRRCAIMLPFTSYMRNMAINLGKALTEKGIDACIFEIPGLSEKLLAKCDRDLLTEFYQNENINEVFSVNATRDELYIPDDIPYYRLIFNQSEQRISADTIDIDQQALWPGYIPPATWYNQYFQKTSSTEQDIDIAVAFNYIDPLPQLDQKNLDILRPYLEAMARQIANDQESQKYHSAEELLQLAEISVNCTLKGPREQLTDFINNELRISVMQTELVRRLSYLSRKHKWNFRIMGKYWDKSEQFAASTMAFAGYNKLMAREIVRCKVVVHADGNNNYSILDTIACGAFSILKENHPGESNALLNDLPQNIMPRFCHNSELEKILHYYLDQNPQERIETASIAQQLIADKFSCNALAEKLRFIGSSAVKAAIRTTGKNLPVS